MKFTSFFLDLIQYYMISCTKLGQPPCQTSKLPNHFPSEILAQWGLCYPDVSSSMALSIALRSLASHTWARVSINCIKILMEPCGLYQEPPLTAKPKRWDSPSSNIRLSHSQLPPGIEKKKGEKLHYILNLRPWQHAPISLAPFLHQLLLRQQWATRPSLQKRSDVVSTLPPPLTPATTFRHDKPFFPWR